MQIHRIAISLLSFLLVFCLIGCGASTDQKTAVTEEGIVIYDTDGPTDSMNYTNYVNKEINLVMNILTTHISNADNLVKGKYILEDELSAVISDRDKVAEAIDSVEGFNPPSQYEDDRAVVLERLVNVDNTLEAYQAALEDGETELQDYIDLMEGDYITLSSAFNLPWE